MEIKKILRITSVPVIVASLCCLSPIILVLVGVSTVSFASSLADTFYGEYKWYFRLAGLLSLLAALFYYFYQTKGVCTLDEAVKRRNEIINLTALTIIVSVAGYIFFLYVVVHYAGVFLNLWN